MLEIFIALVEHLRIHKKIKKKSNSRCVSVIYTSVVLLKAIVSSEMALKLWKVMSSGKGKIPRCTQGSVHTTKLQSKPYQENSHEKQLCMRKKKKSFLSKQHFVPLRFPELSFLKEVQPSVTSDNRDMVVWDTCVSGSVG